MIKTILKYGLAGGIATVIYLNIMLATGIAYASGWQGYISWLTIVLVPIAVFLAMRELKLKHYGGSLPLAPALVTGLVVCIVASLVYSAFNFIDAYFFDLRMYRDAIEMTVEQMKTQGKSEQEIEQKVDDMKQYYYSITPYAKTLLWYLKMGSFYTVGSYLLLKIQWKKPKDL